MPGPDATALEAPSLEGVPTGYWPRRWILVFGCFLSIVVCYIDRVNISYAILPMAKEYGWGAATQGWVLSSFFMGYLATQLAGGWCAARIGGRKLLAFGVLWWSLFTMLTPPAASIARTFGAPETVPAGKHAINASQRSTPSRSSPCNDDTRCMTCEYRSMNISSSTFTVPYSRDTADVVAAEVDEHDVFGAFLFIVAEFLRVRFVFRARWPPAATCRRWACTRCRGPVHEPASRETNQQSIVSGIFRKYMYGEGFTIRRAR